MSETRETYTAVGTATSYGQQVDQAWRHVANRDRYIALLRERLARAAEWVRESVLGEEDAWRVTSRYRVALEAEQQKSARLRDALLEVAEAGPHANCPLCQSDPHRSTCPIGLALAAAAE